jgi:rod shape-determining protein MreC
VLVLLRRYRELILVSVLLVVPLGVFFAHARRPSERTRLDRAVLWLTTPVERAVGWAVSGALSAWRGYAALRGSHLRALEMSHELSRLRLENQQLLADRAEAERLRRLLAFTTRTSDRAYLGARVIGVKLGPTGLQLLTLDRGSDDGVTPMMPVVVAEGVVGRVQSVTGATADVLVLSDRNSSIAVRVERTRARANVRGLGKPDAARLDYALRSEDMIEGDLLVTAGTDGVFPRGIPVGRIAQLQKGRHGLFVDARVTPAVDVTRLEEVMVVAAWERPSGAPPAAIGAGAGPP